METEIQKIKSSKNKFLLVSPAFPTEKNIFTPSDP